MRRPSTRLLALCCLGLPLAGCPAAPESRPPNLVLVMFDDLGDGEIHGLGGNPNVETPVLDRLLGESLVFEHFYAASSICTPTRAAVLTGLAPLRFGYTWVMAGHGRVPGGLPADVDTLPRVLHRAGYSTAHVGKWHLGQVPPHTPHDAGFDYSVFPLWKVSTPNSYFEYQLAVDGDVDHPQPPTGHLTAALADRAIGWVEGRRADPYFLNLWFFAPHEPLAPPADWRRRFADFCAASPAPESCDPAFAALLAWADAQLGRVLEAVDRHDARYGTRTLVLVTSDNGPAKRDPRSTRGLRGKKLRVYEAGIRVPFLARGPGVRPGTSEAVVTATDLLPTLAEIAGVTPPAVDGRSFAHHVFGTPAPAGVDEERTLFWTNKVPRVVRAWEDLPQERWDTWAVRRGARKLVADGHFELFDLDRDPAERHDLCSSEECPEGRDLQLAYQAWRASIAPIPLAAGDEQAVRHEADGSLAFGPGGHLSLGRDYRLDTRAATTDLTAIVEVRPGPVGKTGEMLLANEPGWSLFLKPRPGGWQARLRLAPTARLLEAGVRPAVLASTTLLQPGVWSRLTFTLYGRPFVIKGRALSVVARLYVDGRLEADLRPFPATHAAHDRVLISSPTRTFTGRLREPTFLPIALAPTEVAVRP